MNSSGLFVSMCKKNNLKVTPQRTALYKIITGMKHHPTAEELFDEVRKDFPSISLDTVHRTLGTFSEIGLVHVVEGHGNPRKYDTNLEQHHHIHCMKCHSIFDFFHREFDNIKTPDEVSKNFTVLSKRVVLNVICNKCRSN